MRTTLRNSATGQGLTSLTSASSGLIISTICDNEASATVYTAAGSTIETITTLGTFAAPTAAKIRFKEVDATNHPGLYEIQIADARFAVSSAKFLVIAISGATNLLMKELRVQLDSFDLDVAKPAVTLTAADVTGNLPTDLQTIKTQTVTAAAGVTVGAFVGNATAALSVDASGRIDIGKALGNAVTLDANNVLNVSTKYIGGTAQTARDIGLSVLVSAGTGTGQINLSSGNVTLTDASLTTAKLGTFVLAKTTNITGFNDIAATAIVSSGAITTSGGAVSTVITLTNLPTIPANWLTAAGIAASALNGKGDWLLSSSYSAPPSVASIATGVWQDATGGDFTTAGSIGKALYINAAPGASGGHFISGSNLGTTTFAALTVTGATTLTGGLIAKGIIVNPTTGVALQIVGASDSDTIVITSPGAGADTIVVNNDGGGGSFLLNFINANGAVWHLTNENGGGAEVDVQVESALALLDAAMSSRAPASTALSTGVWTNTKAGFLTGDSFARLGAPAGASVSADLAAVKTDTGNAATMASRFNGMIELSGSAYRYTIAALAQGPSGGGGGGGGLTPDQQAQLDHIEVKTDFLDAPISGCASSIALSNLQTHGDVNWEGADVATLTEAVHAELFVDPTKKLNVIDTADHDGAVYVAGGTVDNVVNPVDPSTTAGDGTTPVNQDTLDTNGSNLLIEIDGEVAGGVRILAYLSAEWRAVPQPGGMRARGETVSLDDGTWKQPIMLASGILYSIVMRIPSDGGTLVTDVLVP